MKLKYPAHRNTGTLHRYCLLIILFIITASASALQPRQAIPAVSLSNQTVNDFATLAAVNHHFELLVKFDDSVQARVHNHKGGQRMLVSETRLSRMISLENLAASYGASFEQILSSTTCPNIDLLLNTAASRSGVVQPDLKGLHRLVLPAALSGQQLLNLRSDLLLNPDVEFVELRNAGPGHHPA